MPIRETFWNIPHWAEIGQYALAVLTVLIFCFGVIRQFRRWRMATPERRTDQWGKRLKLVAAHALAQLRTAEDRYAGVMHLSIFWGMAALLLGTILATVDWDVTHLFFGFQFLTDGIYVFYELVLDILGLFVILGLGMAIYRRYVLKPARLSGAPLPRARWDDAYVLIMLALVAITGYLVEGLRIAVVQPAWAAWSPVGRALAAGFMALGDPTNRGLHVALWIAHGLVAFTFIGSIPFSKMFHVLTAPMNIFFSSLKPAGELAPARAASGPGVKAWKEFTWKQVLDFHACVRCGRCQDQCPAYASGMALSPRDLMIRLRAHVWERGNGRALVGDVISVEDVWSCTTCRACVQACPVFADQLSSIVDLRRHLVNEGRMDTRLQEALANLGRYGNSFGQSERGRAKWTQGLPEKIKDARKEPSEVLWFLGDYASYNAGLTEITRQTAEVFRAAGLDIGILYEAERNSGNDARRVGEEGLFEMLREKNRAVLEKVGSRTIVTTDPHTYNTLKNEYGMGNGSGPAVLHSTELVDQLLTSGRLRLTKRLGYRVTYHDPCYLGRYNGVYEAPRRILAAAGCEVVEMPRSRERAFCCGAGGGRIWMEEGAMRERPSESRIREAVSLGGVQVLAVACPKDVTMYRDALKTTSQEGRIVVKDVMELVREAM
jgi:Fe-S oxidoreductase